MNERRKFNRKYLTYYSRVLDRKSGTFMGYLVDMAPGGIMIVGNYPVDVNKQFEIKIDLPERYNDMENLDLQALSVWCLQDSDPELYRTGLKLLKITPDVLILLDNVITNYGFSKEI